VVGVAVLRYLSNVFTTAGLQLIAGPFSLGRGDATFNIEALGRINFHFI
jgi:hypothetical protein